MISSEQLGATINEPEQSPTILAAIPAYNEAGHIGEIIEETSNYVDQVLVIDDGSTDGTAGIAEGAGAVVVRHQTNRGKRVAINTAFKVARKLKSSVMVLLDGDGLYWRAGAMYRSSLCAQLSRLYS